VQDEEVIGHQLVFDMKGGKGIPASDISDGTLLTLALLTALMTVDRSQLILVDDLERGLHPKAVGDLIQQLRRIQAENPELQIVASSHSPYLVGFLQAEEVLLTSLDEDGYAAIKPLTDHPDYERWKDFMDPGEFWSTVGESWVTKRNASLTPR
jgi:predicted ATPase